MKNIFICQNCGTLLHESCRLEINSDWNNIQVPDQCPYSDTIAKWRREK